MKKDYQNYMIYLMIFDEISISNYTQIAYDLKHNKCIKFKNTLYKFFILNFLFMNSFEIIVKID
jgi:hypothetical protein